MSCLSSLVPLRFASALVLVAAALVAPRAHAQGALPPSQPPPPALPPPSAVAPNGEYIAPLQQQTQQVYVPQSIALSGPRIIKDYDDGEPVPPGYHPETRTRTGLVVGGAVTFGTLYFFSLLVAAAVSDANRATHSSGDDANFLYIPVAGPFLQMTKTESSTGNLFLGIDGIAQGAGAAMLIVGITSPKTVLVRNDLGEVRVTPMRLGQDGNGLGLVGRF
jgi:hypothetical protein